MELKGITPREYQKKIAEAVLKNGNTLVVLPTGLGKTLIALMVAAKLVEKGKVLFLAPTKPLVKQHYESIKRILADANPAILTGDVSKKKRSELWRDAQIIVATPQTVESDISLIKPNQFSLLIIDEAHRAVGKYAYTTIAELLRPYALIMGTTASPGGKREKIDEIMKTLGINHVEIRDLNDPEIKQYFPGMEIEWIRVNLTPGYDRMREKLKKVIDWYLEHVRNYGFKFRIKGRREMLEARNLILRSTLKTKYHAIKYLSAAINLDYGLEMLETQSMEAFLKYMENVKTRDTKGAQMLAKDRRVEEIIEEVARNKRIHPKMQKLVDIISENKDKKFIVFSQYVAQVEYLEKILNLYGIKAHKFVGQRKGFTRKKQLEVIERFRDGEFNVLVASSVGEEGLDIPSVDYVIFYEPVPSEIRSIQRRGRTGRHALGHVYILITRKTRDEAYYYSAKSKERKMKSIIKDEKKGDDRPKKGILDWLS